MPSQTKTYRITYRDGDKRRNTEYVNCTDAELAKRISELKEFGCVNIRAVIVFA